MPAKMRRRATLPASRAGRLVVIRPRHPEQDEQAGADRSAGLGPRDGDALDDRTHRLSGSGRRSACSPGP